MRVSALTSHSKLNPDDFVISRKRKKYRFALFHNSSLCFEVDQWQKQQPVDVVELGAGTALFSVELAARHPDKQFVAVDVKSDRLQKGARQAELRGLSNIRFLRASADHLLQCFRLGSLQQLWLTFPDPFPKDRAAKHRLTHPRFLDIYQQLLAKNGQQLLKHDNHQFFDWSLEQLVASGWRIDQLSFDLHQSDLPSDYKVITSYEQRWMGQGLVTNFVQARPI